MGPLEGVRVIEMAGLAPVPYAGMILADFGAEVIRVDRTPTAGAAFDATRDFLARGKKSVGINLKDARGVDALLRLAHGLGAEWTVRADGRSRHQLHRALRGAVVSRPPG
jgi:crotonobetainyl-CoA:carnitine CoA-transferase CaiB-like acyl-CoA transferase